MQNYVLVVLVLLMSCGQSESESRTKELCEYMAQCYDVATSACVDDIESVNYTVQAIDRCADCAEGATCSRFLSDCNNVCSGLFEDVKNQDDFTVYNLSDYTLTELFMV